MDKQNKTNFWDGFLFKTSHLNDRQEDGVSTINLNGGTERVVQTDQEIFFQSIDANTGEWVTEYQKSKIAPKDYRVTSGYFNLVKQNVVILSCWMGSGGYLHYSIIGKLKGKTVELAKNEGVYKGDIFFKDGKLLQKSANRYSVWIIKDRRLHLAPYNIPTIPGALRIEYHLFPDGRVKIDKTHYKVPVGTIVQFIRGDLHEEPVKGYFHENDQSFDMIEDIPDLAQAFKIVKKGRIEGKIIPDSHRDMAKTILIEAN